MIDSDGPTSCFFDAQRLRLHYLDWGNADAPTAILIHGGRDHAHNWDWFARSLRRDWHVVAPDLRGHGDSQWSTDGAYLSAHFIFDLTELIRHLGVSSVAIVGHSLGGNIAVRYAGLYPETVSKLVAIEGLGPAVPALQDGAERLRRWIADRRTAGIRSPIRYPDFEAALARMRAANPHLDEDRLHHLTRHGSRLDQDGSLGWKFDPSMRKLSPYDLPEADDHALWAAIQCPTLLVHGADSWASNPALDGRAGHFRHARVMSVAGAGHWVHHDQFALFDRDVRAFLAE